MADARDDKTWTFHSKQQKAQTSFPYEESVGSTIHILIDKYSSSGSNLLDYGCGTGLWNSILQFKDINYTGVDQNSDMINFAKERLIDKNVNLIQSSWNTLPFLNNTFDIVFTHAVLQHNLHADKNIVLPEINRILNQKGFLICIENTLTPENISWHGVDHSLGYQEDISDGYSFTKTGWINYMASFHFKSIEFIEPNIYVFQKDVI
jgi:ubiquinone/menaquinone biosynthesis C-methylase UbiE